MKILEQFYQVLELAITKYVNAARLAEKLDVAPNKITRWKNREQTPNLRSLEALFELMGVSLNVPMPDGEASKDVCFVHAKVVGAGENTPPPQVEDYLAVPVVEEVGAGPGLIPQGEILSWFLVYKNQSTIRYRSDLIAVKIGSHSTSMLPVLHPNDIVLIDRQDKDISVAGRIMLVLDPEDGSGMIKRVSTERLRKDRDYSITYYSDNVQYPPKMYSLQEHFDGDWNKSIAGRVVWAWSDISQK